MQGDRGGAPALGQGWTPERVALLREMWAAGNFSAADIADELGLGRHAGRSAVIGKIHRLGLGRKSIAEISAAKARGRAAAAAAKRARPERQRALSGQALAERREQAAAEGKAIIAKVEAEQERRRVALDTRSPLLGTSKTYLHSIDGAPLERVPDLPPPRFRPVIAADNPAVVPPVEEPVDLYSHLRTERSYRDAVAALTRDRKTGEAFHGA